MKSIAVVTSTRAEYGLLSPLIRRIQQDSALSLRLLVTGTHLSAAHGKTVREILQDGVPIAQEIPILAEGDDAQAMSQTMANALGAFSAYFAREPADMAVLLGDRYEICAVAAALANARIPIAHLGGGDTTEGALDECYRHSITKMSYLHFTACETHRKRVIQLGEDPSRVFNMGGLSVENMMGLDYLSREALSESINFDLCSYPYAVVTFHSVTLEEDMEEAQFEELLTVITARSDMRFLITKANADAGGGRINERLDDFVKTHSHCLAVPSLGMRRYLSALKHASFVMGNSSSGIVEAPFFGIPTVNIGDRQKGRLRAQSVIDCPPEADAIAQAINKAMSPEFREIAARVNNPYGDGNTSARIVETIKDFLYHGDIDLKKKFYDVDFEVK